MNNTFSRSQKANKRSQVRADVRTVAAPQLPPMSVWEDTHMQITLCDSLDMLTRMHNSITLHTKERFQQASRQCNVIRTLQSFFSTIVMVQTVLARRARNPLLLRFRVSACASLPLSSNQRMVNACIRTALSVLDDDLSGLSPRALFYFLFPHDIHNKAMREAFCAQHTADQFAVLEGCGFDAHIVLEPLREAQKVLDDHHIYDVFQHVQEGRAGAEDELRIVEWSILFLLLRQLQDRPAWVKGRNSSSSSTVRRFLMFVVGALCHFYGVGRPQTIDMTPQDMREALGEWTMVVRRMPDQFFQSSHDGRPATSTHICVHMWRRMRGCFPRAHMLSMLKIGQSFIHKAYRDQMLLCVAVQRSGIFKPKPKADRQIKTRQSQRLQRKRLRQVLDDDPDVTVPIVGVCA